MSRGRVLFTAVSLLLGALLVTLALIAAWFVLVAVYLLAVQLWWSVQDHSTVAWRVGRTLSDIGWAPFGLVAALAVAAYYVLR